MRMFGPKLVTGSFIVAAACLAIVADNPGTALAQSGVAPAKTRAIFRHDDMARDGGRGIVNTEFIAAILEFSELPDQ
jgi:hypothetical protein